MPGMKSGDIMGHEFMGEVVEVGPENKKLKVGDRVVVPFTICCGECEQCQRGNFSVCERTQPQQRDWREKVFGHTTAGLFGYTHLTGGYAGRAGRVRARALRRRRAASRCPTASPTSRCCSSATSSRPAGRPPCSATSSRPTPSPIWGAGPVGQIGDPQRRAARREAGDRHRPRARAPRHGARPAARSRSTSTRRASSSA